MIVHASLKIIFELFGVHKKSHKHVEVVKMNHWSFFVIVTFVRICSSSWLHDDIRYRSKFVNRRESFLYSSWNVSKWWSYHQIRKNSYSLSLVSLFLKNQVIRSFLWFLRFPELTFTHRWWIMRSKEIMKSMLSSKEKWSQTRAKKHSIPGRRASYFHSEHFVIRRRAHRAFQVFINVLRRYTLLLFQKNIVNRTSKDHAEGRSRVKEMTRGRSQ